MKKQCYFIAAMLLGLFSSASSASILSFWAYGSSDSASKSKYTETIGYNKPRQNISIDYNIDKSNWTINSAQLWIKAVDDFGGGKDRREKARIFKIEGKKGKFASKEINGNKWYNLLDVTSFLLSDTNSTFSALLKSSRGRGFLLKNAKLVIDYDIKSASNPLDIPGSPLPISPPAAVPVPAAVWLFGSAMLGLIGLTRKPKGTRLV
jgi:hypothetical protein